MDSFLLGVGFVLGTILEGFVLKTLWGWFVVSVFGIEPIGIATAIGLSLIVGFFRPTKAEEFEFDKAKVAKHLFTGLVRVVVFLAMGLVVQLFL